MLLIEKLSYDCDSDCGMNVASTMTMVMTRPLTLTLAGAMSLGKLGLWLSFLILTIAMAKTVALDCLVGFFD